MPCSLCERPSLVSDRCVCSENAQVRQVDALFAMRTTLFGRVNNEQGYRSPNWGVLIMNRAIARRTGGFSQQTGHSPTELEGSHSKQGVHLPNWRVLTANRAFTYRTGGFLQQTERSPTDWVVLTAKRALSQRLGRSLTELGHSSGKWAIAYRTESFS